MDTQEKPVAIKEAKITLTADKNCKMEFPIAKDYSNVKAELPPIPTNSNNTAVINETQTNPDVKNVCIKDELGKEKTPDTGNNCNVQISTKAPIKQEYFEETATDTIMMSPKNFSPPSAIFNTFKEESLPESETEPISYSQSFHNISIKEEVDDVIPDAEENEVIEMIDDDGSIEMLELENGCTNSGCNLQNQCLQTYKCGICNLIFTEKPILSAHFKQCSLNNDSAISPSHAKNPNTCKDFNYNQLESHDVKKLIENVRKHACLYNPHHEDYNNAHVMDLIWANISSECNFPNGSIAKTVWKKLKDSYNDALKQQNSHNHQSRKQTKTWKYMKKMEFLLPYMNNRQTTNSQHKRANVEDTVSHNEHTQNDVAMALRATSAKKQKVGPPNNEMQNTRNKESQTKTCREVQARPIASSQPLDMFFLSMCETTKSLPSHLQFQVKRKVFQAVIEAEEGAATINSHVNNLPHASSSRQNEQYINSLPTFSTLLLSNVAESSSSSQD